MGGGAMPQAAPPCFGPYRPRQAVRMPLQPAGLPGFSAAGMMIYFRTSQTVR